MARTKKSWPRPGRFQRVKHIAGMMARGQWDWQEDSPRLAEEWGMQVGSLKDIAAEAGRLLAITVHDIDQLEGWIRWRLKEISEQDEPDRVQALATLAKQIGRLQERHEVNVTAQPTPQLVGSAIRQSLADPEIRAMVRLELEKYKDDKVPMLTSGKELEDRDDQ